MAAIVLVVRLGNEHLVMVSGKHLPADDVIETNPNGTVSGLTARARSPGIRVTSAPFQDTSLKATVDGIDRMTIDYSGADGHVCTVRPDERRHPN